jgi:hypothetical protein
MDEKGQAVGLPFSVGMLLQRMRNFLSNIKPLRRV